MNKPKLYLDMDNVLVDTLPILNAYAEEHPEVAKPDRVAGIFADLPIKQGVKDAVATLNEYFDLYILSTAPWHNPSAWQDKIVWLENQFGAGEGNPFYKKVVMAHDKGLVHGTGGILVDDRPYHGASAWSDTAANSEWIQYGYTEHLTWEDKLVPFLVEVAKNYQETANGSISEAIKMSNIITGPVHGDLVHFEKANWE
ncbi:hypothetical protein OIT44_01500 [Weissella ceti]|uniref:Uncharacterized protein n=1 Tax=Weissella ceti TaxID=759620 RepID=A0ABT3E3C1_9LACO|nr:hypothetical protein [Weissella ceti]MCW0952749.1 hypothetical protein [Weissella ceti]QVK12448.1 hypothetical protein KHQ31_02130 [Weissella ceti]